MNRFSLIGSFIDLLERQEEMKKPDLDWTNYKFSFPAERLSEALEDKFADKDVCGDNKVETLKINSAIRREINALADLLSRKNKDYGNAAFTSSLLTPELDATTAILVRMGDKIRRLKSLTASHDPKVESESFEDTVRDLAGYCILYLATSKQRYSDLNKLDK